MNPDADVLPHDQAAEAYALGGAMLSPAACRDVLDVARPGDFYDPRHEHIATVLADLTAAGGTPDAYVVSDELRHRGLLVQCGGGGYLHDLIAGVPVAANAGYYAGVVVELARRRAAATAYLRGYQAAMTPTAPLDHVLASTAGDLAGAEPRTRTTAPTVDDVLQDVIDDIEDPQPRPGVRWGYADLDGPVNLLAPGQLAVIGARPGVGKSIMLCDVARHVAVYQQRKVLALTLEMDSADWGRRILAAEARVPLTAIITRTVDGDGWERVAKAHAMVTGAPLVIDDTPGVGIGEIRAAVREHQPAVVIVDYLQLIQVDARRSRREGVEQLTRDLKLLAKQEQVAVLVGAQLNRESEKRGSGRPVLSDLRETGTVEQDADVVLLLHRPDMVNPDSDRAGEVDVIVAKQRNGPLGTVALGAQAHYARFCDMARWAQ